MLASLYSIEPKRDFHHCGEMLRFLKILGSSRIATVASGANQQGLQQGIQQGLQQEGKSLVLRLLHRRVGTVPTDLVAQVEVLPLSQLEALGEALLDFKGLEDLVQWLATNS